MCSVDTATAFGLEPLSALTHYLLCDHCIRSKCSEGLHLAWLWRAFWQALLSIQTGIVESNCSLGLHSQPIPRWHELIRLQTWTCCLQQCLLGISVLFWFPICSTMFVFASLFQTRTATRKTPNTIRLEHYILCFGE